jgi:hypothetical protein
MTTSGTTTESTRLARVLQIPGMVKLLEAYFEVSEWNEDSEFRWGSPLAPQSMILQALQCARLDRSQWTEILRDYGAHVAAQRKGGN